MAEDWIGLEGLNPGAPAETTEHKAHVAAEMQNRALIMKESRKAREELRLNAKKGGPANADSTPEAR